MKTKAAIAWKSGAPLSVQTVDLDGPRWGEALIEIKASGICHTYYYTVSGAVPGGLFPAILGHEGAGLVLDSGPGVTNLQKDINQVCVPPMSLQMNLMHSLVRLGANRSH